MDTKLLAYLRCPVTGEPLTLVDPVQEGGRIRTGFLASGAYRYPIREFIPRFVPEANYADNFGMQWNKFRQTQLDSYSHQDISAKRFWRATGWNLEDIRGKRVLDVGCGSGRFAEVALDAGAEVIAFDYSTAVDAARRNFEGRAGFHVVQADIFAMPFAAQSFDFVYSLGVLQHTPDVERAFAAVRAMVAPGGKLCVDYYWRRLRTLLHLKYALRPLTTRMSQERLFALLERHVGWMLKVSQALGKVPVAGKALQRLVPICDYTLDYPLTQQQLYEWALLDTFDMLAPRYDNPQTASTVRAWFEKAGFSAVEVFHEGHLVARGVKA